MVAAEEEDDEVPGKQIYIKIRLVLVLHFVKYSSTRKETVQGSVLQVLTCLSDFMEHIIRFNTFSLNVTFILYLFLC